MLSKRAIWPLLLAILLGGCTASPSAPSSPAASNSTGTPSPSVSPDWAAVFKQDVAAYRAENESKQTPDETCKYLMKCISAASESENVAMRGAYPETASFLVPKYFDVQPTCPSGGVYVYKSVTEPRPEVDITCPTHNRTFNSMAGFR